MNLPVKTAATETSAHACPKCNDLGNLPVPGYPQPGPKGIPAGILFTRGIPCDCAAGEWFRELKEEWNARL